MKEPHNYGSLAGRSEALLRIETIEKYKEHGLNVSASFERKRGRVCIVVEDESYTLQAIALFFELFPDFRLSPDTHDTFLYFNQN